MKLLTVLAVATLFSVPAPSQLQAETVSGHADIVDGDTIKILGVAIRLNGIDAPERLQDCKDSSGNDWQCGREATRKLVAMIGGNEVTCQATSRDRFDRWLAECFVGSESLNARMVSEGWAFAFIRYSDRFLPEQNQAESNSAGIWAGTFEYPWDWRAGVALSAASASSNDECVIKGNISSSGERIYHMPFQQFYARTRINENRGEKWFCTEEQAQLEGWRRALQ